MPFTLDATSRRNLSGVHPDLVRVVERAAKISPIPFRVTEGLRTIARQRQLKAQGLSKTLNSRHLTGHAVDIVPIVDLNGDGKVSGDEMWHHSQLLKLSPHIKAAFKAEGVPYDWGGDWRNAWDKPHWQLPWNRYPIQVASLFSDPEMESAWLEVQEDARMETPAIKPGTAAALTEGSAALGAGALLTDGMMKIQEAERQLTAGNIISMVIGLVTLTVAAGMMFDRWDAAGRPVPRWFPGWLKRGLGSNAD